MLLQLLLWDGLSLINLCHVGCHQALELAPLLCKGLQPLRLSPQPNDTHLHCFAVDRSKNALWSWRQLQVAALLRRHRAQFQAGRQPQTRHGLIAPGTSLSVCLEPASNAPREKGRLCEQSDGLLIWRAAHKDRIPFSHFLGPENSALQVSQVSQVTQVKERVTPHFLCIEDASVQPLLSEGRAEMSAVELSPSSSAEDGRRKHADRLFHILVGLEAAWFPQALPVDLQGPCIIQAYTPLLLPLQAEEAEAKEPGRVLERLNRAAKEHLEESASGLQRAGSHFGKCQLWQDLNQPAADYPDDAASGSPWSE